MSGLQPTGDATLAPNSSAAWTERYRGAVMDTFGPPQRVLVRGEGAYVWDADGKRYLDLLAGIAVNALGHAHPTLTAAISAQLGTLAVSKDVFDKMAKITRSGDALMDVSGEGVDKLGSLSLTGITGRMLSVPVQMVPGAAANTAAFIDPTALQMWEAGGPFQLQQDDTTKLLSNYSVYGYAAFATVFTGGVMPLGPKAAA